MKPQFKLEQIYLDLSKLSEEQRNNAKTLTGIKSNSERIYLSFSPIQKVWGYFDSIGIKGKQELTYSQFLDMMGESEEVLQVENNTREDIKKAYRAGEKGATYYFKDTTVILPTTYEGVDG